VFKRIAFFLVLSLAAAGVAVSASSTADSASKQTTASRMLVGFYDDEQIYGRTDWAFNQLKSLRAGVVRITLDWASVARRRPGAPADPASRAYNWTAVDNVVTKAAKQKMRVVMAIYGTPRWAGPAKNRLPRRITDLRLFAFAAATRYSGTYEVEVGENEPARSLPAVRHWLAWNEPNNPVFLKPQWKKVGGTWRPQSAYDYAKICSAIWAGVHSTGLANEKVACGVTGPRGNDAPASSRASTSPLVFLTWLRRAGLKRFDAYAHHPYYGSKTEKPTTMPTSKKSVTLANIGLLINQLNRLYGRSKRLWVTEYGYQTRPPDRLFGVSYATQAKYVHQAIAKAKKTRRIDMFVWFLIRDERRLSGWQSGVVTVNGRRKPAYRAFQTAKR
jgi:Glycosyl hydrolase catalytic core